MKNLVLVIKPKNGADLKNVLNHAIGDQQPPTGAHQLVDGVWLIDVHKCLSFFSGLICGAQKRDLDVFAFSADDIIDAPTNLKNALKDQAPK